MTEAFFSSIFIDKFKILITGFLIYVIIFALLNIVKPLGSEKKVNSLIALLTAIIVSFSGVVTYAISYAINWFVIIFFIIFIALTLMMFLGIKPNEITSGIKGKTSVYILGAFILLFSIILIKSFFALNNNFDTRNPPNNVYDVNTNYNSGFTNNSEKLQKNQNSISFFNKISSNKDLLNIVLFFIGIGILMIFIGRGK